MLGIVRPHIKPIGIIERSSVEANSRFKTLKRKKNLRSTGVAEIDIDLFATAFGCMLLNLWNAFDHRKMRRVKYWFQQIGPACRPLAKLAVAHRYTSGLVRNLIPKLAA